MIHDSENNINLTNLTKELENLQSKYDNLTKDLDLMTKQEDECQSRYNILLIEKRHCGQ